MFANNFAGQKNICCGLVSEGQRPIPLVSVDVRASLIHAAAQVEITQNYVNKEEQLIEAIYYFPVDPDGSVTNFQAELNGRVIKGTVKPREEAQKVYAEAIANKKTSFLGEETNTDIFKLRVGILEPGALAKIVIEYITEVKNDPGTNNIRFCVPTTIVPRYVSSTETDSEAKSVNQNMQFSMSSPAALTINVTVSIQGAAKSIECPTHRVIVKKTKSVSKKNIFHKAVVKFFGKTTDMDRDFVLTIEPLEKHQPRLYSEKNGADNSTAVMIHLLPSFKLCEQKTELIFLLDRSMGGNSFALAKDALLLFLHSIPADCYFNVVGFGSKFKFLFPTSVKYDDGSLTKAKAYATEMTADMGGTGILAPLQIIFGQPGIDGYLRQIFIVTDGEVSNTKDVFGIVRVNAHKLRVFALGIGDAASHGLVHEIARAGYGTAAYVTYNERMDEKVIDQLKNALQLSLTEIHLEWEGLSPPIQEAPFPFVNKSKSLLAYSQPIVKSDALTSAMLLRMKQSPDSIPPVCDGSQLLVFGLFKNGLPTSALITAQSPDGPLTVRIEHSPSNNLDVGARLLLHRLAAIKLVRELKAKEDSEPRQCYREEIEEIACKNGITSRYTSFIAIDVNDDEQSMKETWVMEARHVPNQIAHGWHGGQDPFKMLQKCARQGGIARSCAATIQFHQMMSQMNHLRLMQLMNLQSYNGSFTLNEELVSIVGKSLADMIAASNKHNLAQQVFATALAVNFLVKNSAYSKQKWDLIVAKARKWLGETVQPENVDAIVELTSDFLNSQ